MHDKESRRSVGTMVLSRRVDLQAQRARVQRGRVTPPLERVRAIFRVDSPRTVR